MDQPKKPRHRHKAFQLAALNELYDRDEHPSLEDRTALAEQLGMETKTVNSWFQNKRASSKKRHKGPPTTAQNQVELPPISALIASVSAPLPPSEFDELSDDEHFSRLPLSATSEHAQQQSLFYAGNPQHQHLFDAENSTPRKARSRPSNLQTEQLRKVYDLNPHPSKDEREELGQRIGMRYQSVTNWFQNQRSIAKKRKEEEDAQAASSASSTKSRTYSPFPPAAGSSHPSLAIPPAVGRPSLVGLAHSSRKRRSSSLAFGASAGDSRPVSPRVSPYRTPAADRALTATHARPRRTRPEPFQLEALKKLFHRTATPSIEERGALAMSIGMDVGKVTNWFRNLRQTTRKRIQRGDVDMDDDEDDSFVDDADNVSLATYGHSRSVSRAASAPSSSYSGSAPYMDAQDLWARERFEFAPYASVREALDSPMYGEHAHSDMGSEEDIQEAVTPSPESSPAPPPVARMQPEVRVMLGSMPYEELERVSARFHNVKVEDALLLLGFHHHVVR